MVISQKDLKILLQRSGNRCAFPGCGKILVHPETDADEPVLLSEIAHIVARKPDGPRGQHPLPLEHRDYYDNLILLCEEHHHIVDGQPQIYAAECLHEVQNKHEMLMAETTGRTTKHRCNTAISALPLFAHSELLAAIQQANAELRAYPNEIAGIHIERVEVSQIAEHRAPLAPRRHEIEGILGSQVS